MALFGAAKINVVTSGTDIRNEDTDELLGTVTDSEIIFCRDSVFLTASALSRMRNSHKSSATPLNAKERGLLH